MRNGSSVAEGRLRVMASHTGGYTVKFGAGVPADTVAGLLPRLRCVFCLVPPGARRSRSLSLP